MIRRTSFCALAAALWAASLPLPAHASEDGGTAVHSDSAKPAGRINNRLSTRVQGRVQNRVANRLEVHDQPYIAKREAAKKRKR